MKTLRILNLLQIVLLTGMVLFSFCVSAQTNTPTSQLTNLLNNFHSMQAQFNQSIIDPHGNAISQSSGKMALLRPGKFRWETQLPAQQLALADGKYIWVYDTQLQQVTRQKQQATTNNSPAALLSGNVTKLAQEFVISLVPPIAHTDQGFNLVPKDKDALFQSVQLYFNHGLLQSMQLKDNLDQTTVVQFHKVKNNAAISTSLFQFTPPKGVDVVTGP